MLQDGKLFTVEALDRNHPHWLEVELQVNRKNNDLARPITVLEVYSVRWRQKPFPFSYHREFKCHRRFFFHGTSLAAIEKILDEGFKILPRQGALFDQGVYVSFHSNKALGFAPEGYVLSVMVYAPEVRCFHPGEQVTQQDVQSVRATYHAIEVRQGAIVPGWTMRNHELCVFDPVRVVPRFISRLSH